MTLFVRDIISRPVVVPMRRPLRTGAGAVTEAPLLLIDLETEDGITGRSYLFGYAPLTLKPLHELIGVFAGLVRRDAVAPMAIDQKLRARAKLLGIHGLVGMALAGIEMACWDALASALGVPLVVGFGVEIRKPSPSYRSSDSLLPASVSNSASRRRAGPGAGACGDAAAGMESLRICYRLGTIRCHCRRVILRRSPGARFATPQVDPWR